MAAMHEEQSDTFGTRLRRLREAAGLTQEHLAERAGLSANAIGALERGERRRPYPHTLLALADALGLSPTERTALADTVALADRAAASLPPDPAAALPTPPTRLVGRDREVAALVARLSGSGPRLLTLTGPGGVGKTRLALAVAAEAAAGFPDGVAVVSLAPLTDPALVLPTLAGSLGLREAGGRDLRDALRAYLAPRQLLLVLDNFEHLLAAAVDLAAVIAAGPQLRVLVTSRAPLHLRGEQEVPVEPLGVPELVRVPSVAEVAEAAAVRLFVERAREVAPSFTLTPVNAAAVAAICRRLDGLPLAIELAAAWVKVLTPVELLARLDQALPLLAGGSRDLPGRQRTMRDAIAWSYDLLDPAAQVLFRRLAVFAGGFSLEAAEVVGSDPGRTNEEALDLIRLLVEQSLVVRESGQEARYRLLEPVRQYAQHLLEVSGEAEAIRQAHAAWSLRLAEEAEATLGRFGADAQWLNRLEDEHDNLRVALGWLLQSGNGTTALQLATALWPFWHFHSHLSEGRRWLQAAIAAAPQAPATTQARALLGAAFLAHYQGDDGPASDLVDKAHALAQAIDDTPETLPRRRVHLLSLLARGIIAEDQGNYATGEAALQEAYRLACTSGDQTWAAVTLFHLGIVAYGQGHADAAVARLEEALASFRILPDLWGAAGALGYLGLVAMERRDQRRAAALHAESLALFREIGSQDGMASSLANVATLLALSGHHETAARLFGAAAALAEEVMGLPKLPERAAHDHGLDIARAALAPKAFAAAYAAGRKLPAARAVDEAITRATDLAAEPVVTPTAAPARPAGLSEREMEVLHLVAQGLTNPQIAERLYLSPRTVESHVQHICTKLNVPNRAAAIRVAVQNGLI